MRLCAPADRDCHEVFESQIQRAAMVALFVPLIISSGGNSGSQATTIIIRSLALGEITLRDWWHICGRELMTGLVPGLFLGLMSDSVVSLRLAQL